MEERFLFDTIRVPSTIISYKYDIHILGRSMPQNNKSKKININKKDLTEKLSMKAGIPKTKAAQYIDQITDIIAEALLLGKKVTISDFGTFNLSERSSFVGYDPRNDKKIHVPRRIIPVFRSGKKLKNALNLPMIQDVVLIGAKKIEVIFSRLVHLEDENVLNKSNYVIHLNGEKANVQSIEIAKKSIEICHDSNKKQMEIEGIFSVYISFSTTLFNKKIEMCIEDPPQDIFENCAPQSIYWPR